MTPQRFLGLELAGAKNQKTTLAVLEFYPKERKLFLLDIHEGIGSEDRKSGDQVLLEQLSSSLRPREKSGRYKKNILGVNVPLTFPPCVDCQKTACLKAKACRGEASLWTYELMKSSQKKGLHVKEFTAYTQRPVEAWIRYKILPELPKHSQFEIDEALGGNRAPLTARIGFLKKFLKDFELVEVNPKLSLSLLEESASLEPRWIKDARVLDVGIHARSNILARLCDHFDIFVYERDMKRLSEHLQAFDAFICAFTGLLNEQGQCAKPPRGFKTQWGWLAIPTV